MFVFRVVQFLSSSQKLARDSRDGIREVSSAASPEDLNMPVTVAVLEERVNNNVLFFRSVIGFLFLWLATGTWLLIDIRSDLGVLKRPQKLTEAAGDPTNPTNRAEAQKIIAAARRESIPLPQIVVQRSGKRFVDASGGDAQAWPIAIELASYRTELNSDLLQIGTADQIARTPVDKTFFTHYSFRKINGLDPPTFSVGGTVPADRAAMMYDLSNGPQDLGQPQGKEVILGEGGVLQLDGEAMRHVVLRNTQVVYDGGATELSDVIFVNCTFLLKNTPTARLFALAVLSESIVTFPPTQI
jgi:hypothetical protein